jgi:hypothetical protein
MKRTLLLSSDFSLSVKHRTSETKMLYRYPFLHRLYLVLLESSVADPDPRYGAFLTPGSGWVKNQDPDLGLTTQIIFPRA